MIEQIRQELELITDSITSRVEPKEIYLFGSYAYGQPNEGSDLDVYLVVSDADIDTIQLCAYIHKSLYKKINTPLDLLIGKNSVFERRKNQLTLESIIATRGIKIYDGTTKNPRF